MKAAIIYMLAIVGAEFVVYVLVQPVWGVVFHIVILVAVIMHSAIATNLSHRHRQLVLSLALVPLVRILSLSMPLINIPQAWWYLVIYIPLIVAAIVAIRVMGYRLKDVGLSTRLSPIQLAVAPTGIAFGLAEYFILVKIPAEPLAIPLIPALTWSEIWLPALMFIVFTGFGEELIFRGVLQRAAVDAFGTRGIIYVSFLFAILHMGFLSWVDIVFVFLVALFFGWVVKRTGSLLGVTLSHGITNVMLYLILPFFL